MSDDDLIRQFAERGDQAAFAQIVRRHIDWVYSTSLRRTGGNHALADDVTQAVFILLAQKAGSMRRNVNLASWLFAACKYCHRSAVRHEQRLHQREQLIAATRNEATSTFPMTEWEELAQVLDDTIGRLGRADRQAILMRYYQGHTLAQVGQGLGISEEAARKRITRALEELRGLLQGRGFTMAGAGLAGVLAANTVGTAPEQVVMAASAAPASQASPALHIARRARAMWRRAGMVLPLAIAVPTIAMAVAAVTLAPSFTSPSSTPRAISVNRPATVPTSRPLSVGARSRGMTPRVFPTTAPGEPVHMDFRDLSTGLPLELVSVRILIQAPADPATVKLQLSSGEILSIPYAPGGVIFKWYNPVYQSPGGNVSMAMLTSAWWNELSPDGILDAHIWFEGATRPATFFQFNVTIEAFNAPVSSRWRPSTQ